MRNTISEHDILLPTECSHQPMSRIFSKKFAWHRRLKWRQNPVATPLSIERSLQDNFHFFIKQKVIAFNGPNGNNF